MTATLTGRPVISATGLFTPPESITNEELVASFNAFVDRHNAANPDAEPLAYSSVEFIEKASGIKARHVMSKAPILDPEIIFADEREQHGDRFVRGSERESESEREHERPYHFTGGASSLVRRR